MPGAAAVSKANWIAVSSVHDTEEVAHTISTTGLGAGETSAVLLARELAADLLLMDERKGRRLAKEKGVPVLGCVGILEEFYRRGGLNDLRQAYEELLRQSIRIDLRTLQGSLKQFNLPAL